MSKKKTTPALYYSGRKHCSLSSFNAVSIASDSNLVHGTQVCMEPRRVAYTYLPI